MLFPAGTAATPGVQVGQTNTGLFRPVADTTAIAIGGVEKLRIDAEGRIGSNSSSLGGTNGAYNLSAQITGSANSNGVVFGGLIHTAVTGTANVFLSQPPTAGGFTNLRHFIATQGTLGGTVTNQIGFLAASTLVGATNNFGFYSSIPTSTGDWNYYADGTAPNYFEGDVRTNSVLTERTVTANQDVTSTASVSSLLSGIRTGTPTGSITLQVPTGAGLDSTATNGFQDLQNNQAFEWSVINLAPTTHTITVTSNTGHTLVGNMIVAANSSGRFKTRKTSASTFVTYRIG